MNRKHTMIDRKQIERRASYMSGGDWTGAHIFAFDFETKMDGKLAGWSAPEKGEQGKRWQFSNPSSWKSVISPAGHLMLPYDRFIIFDPDATAGPNVIKTVERISSLEVQVNMTAGELWLKARLSFDPKQEFLKRATNVIRLEGNNDNPPAALEVMSDEIALTVLFLMIFHNPEVQRVEKFKKKRDHVTKAVRESNKFEILVDRRSVLTRVKTLMSGEEYDPETLGVSHAAGDSRSVGSRIGHKRAKHDRTLRSSFYRHKQGQIVSVRETWIGPREWPGSGGYTYRVLTKDHLQSYDHGSENRQQQVESARPQGNTPAAAAASIIVRPQAAGFFKRIESVLSRRKVNNEVRS